MQFHALTVAAVEQLTDEARAITFSCPADLAEQFRYQPGQHLTVRRVIDGQEVRRSYSICAVPRPGDELPILRVAAARVPGGAVSPWLVDQVEPGDVVDVLPPLGSFTCPTDPAAVRHHVAFAAGSGITPVLSLLATALELEPLSRATLVYGNRASGTK